MSWTTLGWGLVLTLLTAAAARAEEGMVSFGPPPEPASLIGEELEFVIRWGPLPAGRATLSVEALPDDRLLLRATARSLEWLDWIYPVRNTMEAAVSQPTLLTERMTRDAKEGRRRRLLETVIFDRRKRTAHRERNGRESAPLRVPRSARDPLAAFYAFRSLHEGGEAARLVISDGKRVIESSIEILGRETVKTPAGRFSTIKIEPSVAGIGGVFRQSPGARIFIWLTDDARRRPVRLESKVAIGRVTAELTSQSP